MQITMGPVIDEVSGALRDSPDADGHVAAYIVGTAHDRERFLTSREMYVGVVVMAAYGPDSLAVGPFRLEGTATGQVQVADLQSLTCTDGLGLSRVSASTGS